MRPVHNAALIVPLVLALEAHGISDGQGLDTWREVDVVGDQQGLSGVEFNDEALVPAAVVVVGEDPGDGATALSDEVAAMFGESRSEDVVSSVCCRTKFLLEPSKLRESGNRCDREAGHKDVPFFHGRLLGS